MKTKLVNICLWETDDGGNPTGIEKVVQAKSVRDALSNLSSKIGGELSSSRLILKRPDGKKWFGIRI